MTTNFSHANCSHPKTSKARAACRKAMSKGGAHVEPLTTVVAVPVDTLATHLSTEGHMGRADAMRITEDLLQQHGLVGWHLVFDNARRRAGACSYGRKQIRLSSPLMAQRSWADTHMTITHEIAHALTEGHNHDQVWAAKHRELGGNGMRCFEHEDHTAPWIGTCAHGKVFSKYRQPKHLEGWRCKCVRNAPTFAFERNPNA